MRDHRHSKLMAKAMREALAEKNLTITHSEALEIVARQFGLSEGEYADAKKQEA